MEISDYELENGEEVASYLDVCDTEELKLFVNCKCENEVVVTSDYILEVDATRESSPHIIVATAEKQCILYKYQNSQVAKLAEYSDYNDKIIGCRFSSRDTNLIYSASSNGTVNLLDLRTPAKPVIQFRDTTAQLKIFNCFDVSANDRLLAAGTDVIGGDAFILFWDTRKQNVLGGYWESHDDDITQVKFHPEDMNKLASGSVDGLINIYDLTQTSEDDALSDTFNTNSSVERLSWFNNIGAEYISCITHTSDLQLWDTKSGDAYIKLGRLDIYGGMKEGVYLAQCHETRDGVLVLAGSNLDGKTLLGLSMKKKVIEPYVRFETNKQRIRCSFYNKNNGLLITGGEKGLLNIWNTC